MFKLSVNTLFPPKKKLLKYPATHHYIVKTIFPKSLLNSIKTSNCCFWNKSINHSKIYFKTWSSWRKIVQMSGKSKTYAMEIIEFFCLQEFVQFLSLLNNLLKWWMILVNIFLFFAKSFNLLVGLSFENSLFFKF